MVNSPYRTIRLEAYHPGLALSRNFCSMETIMAIDRGAEEDTLCHSKSYWDHYALSKLIWIIITINCWNTENWIAWKLSSFHTLLSATFVSRDLGDIALQPTQIYYSTPTVRASSVEICLNYTWKTIGNLSNFIPSWDTLHCLIEDTCLLFDRTAFLLDAFYCTPDEHLKDRCVYYCTLDFD